MYGLTIGVCISLRGSFAERQLQGLFCSSFPPPSDSAVWAQVTWYLGLVRRLPCSGVYPDHLWDQEGGKGEEGKEEGWGVLQCLTIRVLL